MLKAFVYKNYTFMNRFKTVANISIGFFLFLSVTLSCSLRK